MTITTYATLKTAIKNWNIDRDLSASSYDDEFIDLAEAYFNTELRVRQMETSTDITPSSNVYALPSDFLEARRVVEKASIRRPLEYITPDIVEAVYADRNSGLSSHWTIVGSSLYTFPLSTNDVELTYYQKVPALSASNTTNWLLTLLPNLYLHTCLMYAAEFIKDNEEVGVQTQFVQTYVKQLEQLDMRANLGSAGMYINGPTP